jgi:hypothetical protein
MVKTEDTSPTSAGKKKRVEEEPIFEDVASKPLQLQRRRVWRACESCRYVVQPLTSAHRKELYQSLLFSLSTHVDGRRSSAMDVNQHARNAVCRGRNAPGSKPKIGPH